jgi:hypothetical protein
LQRGLHSNLKVMECVDVRLIHAKAAVCEELPGFGPLPRPRQPDAKIGFDVRHFWLFATKFVVARWPRRKSRSKVFNGFGAVVQRVRCVPSEIVRRRARRVHGCLFLLCYSRSSIWATDRPVLRSVRAIHHTFVDPDKTGSRTRTYLAALMRAAFNMSQIGSVEQATATNRVRECQDAVMHADSSPRALESPAMKASIRRINREHTSGGSHNDFVAKHDHIRLATPV